MRLLSPSSINIYRRCPRKFYFYINGYKSLPPPPRLREPLGFGRAIHEVIAHYYRIIPDSITPTEVKMYVTKAYKDVFPESLRHLRKRAERQLLNFIKFERERLKWHISPKPVAVEKEFIKGNVHGVVDAIFRKGEDVIVVDWKTGRSKARLTEDIVIQMNVYLYLTGASTAYVIFLEFGDYAEVTRTLDVEAIVKEILRDREFLPRVGSHCRECEFQMVCRLDELPNTLHPVYEVV